MDVLAVILACSVYPDDALVQALIAFQSEGNPYFVGDTSTLQSKDGLKSLDDALRAAIDIEEHHGRPAVGLLGIPLAWATRYGRAPAELFDACRNIAVGTAALAEYRDLSCEGARRHSGGRATSPHRRTRRRLDSPTLRSCVLSHFAKDLGVTAKPAAILTAIASAPPRNPATERGDDPAAHAAIFGEVPGEGSLTEAWTDATGHAGIPASPKESIGRGSGTASSALPSPSLE